MQRLTRVILSGLLVAACGSEAHPQLRKDASGIDACALLTPAEIEAAAGWKVEETKPETFQKTSTCTYSRADGAKVKTIVLVVSPGMKVLESSAAMAKWRGDQVARYPEMKITVEPVEGLGVPAISSRSADDPAPSLETSAKGVLLSVRSESLDLSKTLAGKAIARLP